MILFVKFKLRLFQALPNHRLLTTITSLILISNEILYAQIKKELRPYLIKNKLEIETSCPDWSNFFYDDFYQNNIFLVGERHGVAYTYDAVYKIFCQIKEKTNFKYFLLEAPFYWEKNLNAYFTTGNENYLKNTFYQAKGTFYANKEFYNFFKKIYELNASLESKDKIKFICIDVEHQYKYSHAMLLNTFNNHLKGKQDTCHFLKFFYKNNPEKTNEYRVTYSNYAKHLKDNREELIKEFDTTFSEIEYLINNINNKFIANSDKKDLARDSLMFENFKLKAKHINLNKEKMFGFFGIDHCYLEKTENAKYFGTYLKENQIKATSIIALYSNCETSIPSHYLPKIIRVFYSNKPYFTTKLRSNDRFFERQKHIGILKENSNSSATLFKLNSIQTPFGNHSLFIDDLKTNKATTNFFHYIILIKNSPAAKTYF